MEEDDMDFTPTQGASSNLASIFGFNKKPLQGNPSLTYTAPKAPKKETSPIKKQVSDEQSNKGKFLCTRVVEAYKLENKNYVSLGVTGIVIGGNMNSYVYDIILYKPTKEHLTKTRITKKFAFTLSPNNYGSFYDDNRQNWSIRFKSASDAETFAEMVGICMFYSHPRSTESILTQNLTPEAGPQAITKNTVDIVYRYSLLEPEGPKFVKDDCKDQIRLSDSYFTPLNEGLIGCSENSKRAIFIPHKLFGKRLSELSQTHDLMFVVEVLKISELDDSRSESLLTEDGADSPMDSSTEEATVKARRALKESVNSTKSQKANLISRMARMGQVALPLKRNSSANLSDSEEENSTVLSPKPRNLRSRASTNNAHQNLLPSKNSTALNQVSIYQNESAWQQNPLAKSAVAYQQLIPVSASPIASPTTDPSFTAYISESRVQAAELRMGISKVSDKVDLVLNKMMSLSITAGDSKLHQSGSMDSTGIISNIQTLILDNESLKEKVEKQKLQIEEQNDRIFQLLQLNHKYLEQSSSSHDKQSENEFKLKYQVESLQKKEVQWESDNLKTMKKIKTLEEDLSKAEDTKKKLKDTIVGLNMEVDKVKKSLEDTKKAKEAERIERIVILEEKLNEMINENEILKTTIKHKEELEPGKEEIKNLKLKIEEYEKAVKTLNEKIAVIKCRAHQELEVMSKLIRVKEEENKSLLLHVEEEKKRKNKEMKDIIHHIATALTNYFSDKKDSTLVLGPIQQCLKDTTGNYYPSDVFKELDLPKPEIKVVKSPVEVLHPVQTARTIVQNSEPRKLIEGDSPAEKKKGGEDLVLGKKKTEDEKRTKEDSKDIGENEEKKDSKDNRYKSYDQVTQNSTEEESSAFSAIFQNKFFFKGWRTSKPPPPPLFDDDDDDEDWLN